MIASLGNIPLFPPQPK